MSGFGPSVLAIDPAAEAGRIAAAVRRQVLGELHRRGVVVGLSGGIDSSVVAALCVEALGRERVFGLFMPESDSASESVTLGRLVAETLGIETALEDIGPVLDAVGCYRRRDDAIRSVIPEYGPGHKSKLVLPSVLQSDRYSVYSVVVRSPEGIERRARLTLEAYLGIVAATNFKQRTRKMVEYHHADRLNFAVAGTPNRLEYDQGFFVKNGDGAADVKPIAHLYKSQVYQLAEYLGVPEAIRRRPSTTDTYSLAQSQEEFYFSLPLAQMDLCLYAMNHRVPPAEVADALGLTVEEIGRIFRDIERKRRATRYGHLPPLLVDDIPEVPA